MPPPHKSHFPALESKPAAAGQNATASSWHIVWISFCYADSSCIVPLKNTAFKVSPATFLCLSAMSTNHLLIYICIKSIAGKDCLKSCTESMRSPISGFLHTAVLYHYITPIFLATLLILN